MTLAYTPAQLLMPMETVEVPVQKSNFLVSFTARPIAETLTFRYLTLHFVLQSFYGGNFLKNYCWLTSLFATSIMLHSLLIFSKTRYLFTGIGIYVVNSYYLDNTPVTNNSLIVRQRSSGQGCSINVYCYSNTTSSDVGHVIFPNGEVYSNEFSGNVRVDRKNPSGIQFQNSKAHSYYLGHYGIYTCELPADFEGNTLEASIGIYRSTPSMNRLNLLLLNHNST